MLSISTSSNRSEPFLQKEISDEGLEDWVTVDLPKTVQEDREPLICIDDAWADSMARLQQLPIHCAYIPSQESWQVITDLSLFQHRETFDFTTGDLYGFCVHPKMSVAYIDGFVGTGADIAVGLDKIMAFSPCQRICIEVLGMVEEGAQATLFVAKVHDSAPLKTIPLAIGTMGKKSIEFMVPDLDTPNTLLKIGVIFEGPAVKKSFTIANLSVALASQCIQTPTQSTALSKAGLEKEIFSKSPVPRQVFSSIEVVSSIIIPSASQSDIKTESPSIEKFPTQQSVQTMGGIFLFKGTYSLHGFSAVGGVTFFYNEEERLECRATSSGSLSGIQRSVFLKPGISYTFEVMGLAHRGTGKAFLWMKEKALHPEKVYLPQELLGQNLPYFPAVSTEFIAPDQGTALSICTIGIHWHRQEVGQRFLVDKIRIVESPLGSVCSSAKGCYSA